MDKVLGIINFEAPYSRIKGLEDSRPIAAASFLGRYRVVDFTISNFTNSRIKNMKVFIKNRPRSLVEHINGTNYNINSKKGNIHILYGERDYINEVYNTDITALHDNMQYILETNTDYVVVAPSNFIYTQDFSKAVEFNKKNDYDITILYQDIDDADENFLMCDVLRLDKDGRVTHFSKNRGRIKSVHASLEAYVMSRELFVELVEKAYNTSSLYSLSNIITDSIDHLKVYGYKHEGYAACLNSLKAYYDCDMYLKDNIHELIQDNWPIYTKTNDSCPTLYKEGASCKGSIVGNGCIIEGEVVNSVISRNVVVKKGAKIVNSIVLPDAVIGEDSKIEDVLVDRFATVSKNRVLTGSKDNIIYVRRGDVV